MSIWYGLLWLSFHNEFNKEKETTSREKKENLSENENFKMRICCWVWNKVEEEKMQTEKVYVDDKNSGNVHVVNDVTNNVNEK